MRVIALALALVVSAAASGYTHKSLAMPFAGGIDLVIFILVYVVVRQMIKAYLDE